MCENAHPVLSDTPPVEWDWGKQMTGLDMFLCEGCVAKGRVTLGPRPTGRILTPDEREFLIANGFEAGYDTDDQDPQLTHICWPYCLNKGALCQTPHLWFHGGSWGRLRGDGKTRVENDDRVDCVPCLTQFEDLKRRDPELLAAIGEMSRIVRTLQHVSYCARDFLTLLDKPELEAKARALGYGRGRTARQELDAALSKEDEGNLLDSFSNRRYT